MRKWTVGRRISPKAEKITDLPYNARKYLDRIVELSGVPLYLLSVGAARHETIVLKNPFLD